MGPVLPLAVEVLDKQGSRHPGALTDVVPGACHCPCTARVAQGSSTLIVPRPRATCSVKPTSPMVVTAVHVLLIHGGTIITMSTAS